MVTNALVSLSSTTGAFAVDNQNVQTSQVPVNETFANVIWTLLERCHHNMKYLTSNIIYSGHQIIGPQRITAKRYLKHSLLIIFSIFYLKCVSKGTGLNEPECCGPPEGPLVIFNSLNKQCCPDYSIKPYGMC